MLIFLLIYSFPEGGLQPGSWARWALMAFVLIAEKEDREREHEWRMVDEYSRLADNTIDLMPHTV